MTESRRARTIKANRLKDLSKRLRIWKNNRIKFDDELSNNLIDLTIAELEKCEKLLQLEGGWVLLPKIIKK